LCEEERTKFPRDSDLLEGMVNSVTKGQEFAPFLCFLHLFFMEKM
jgi:hypothetical protein